MIYLSHIRDVEVETIYGVHSRGVRVREVFHYDLPGTPLDKDIDFCNDLKSCSRPIFIPPFRMALTELRELNAQDILDKGLILPSAFPWGALVCSEK